MSEDTIWIITADADSKGNDTYPNPWDTSKITEVATRSVKVSVEKLETELSHFLQLIGKVFNLPRGKSPDVA